MPFLEFITSGDLKFVLVFIVFLGVAIFHFIKKSQASKNADSIDQIKLHNGKINKAASWVLILSVLSLLLGLMHSLYFIAKAGGVAPQLIFQGLANTLITPVLGIFFFIVCKILASNFGPKLNSL